jgi:hypothetical protein
MQIDPKDPTYKQIDNDIKITFGIERGNWKPQTVSKLFRFFLPNKELDNTSENLMKDVVDDIFLTGHDIEVSSVSTNVTKAPFRIYLNMSIEVQEITLNLVNKNNHVKMY